MEESKDIIRIFGEYPHSLMQHIQSMLRIERKGIDWLLTEEFILNFSDRYSEYSSEIKELNLAEEKGIIKSFYEKKWSGDWEKRVFIRTALFTLLNDLKEYEAVELLESLMWVFSWEIIIEVERKWETSEEDRANFHNSGNVQDLNSGNLAFEVGMKNHIEKKENQLQKEKVKQKEQVRASQKVREELKESPIREKEKVRDREKEKRISARKEIETSWEKVSNLKQEKEETPKEIMTMQKMVSIDSFPEEEYKKILREVKVKHENLMSLSVRKEVKKAKRGNVLSQISVADFYSEEKTEHTDLFEAAKWYSFAVRQGSQKAKFELGKIFDSEKLLENPEVRKQLESRTDVISTKQYGIRYFMELAKEGYPTAQSILGMKYYLGDGVEEDKAKGIIWLKQAAMQGQMDAQMRLGEIYATVDKKESEKWFQMANRGKKR